MSQSISVLLPIFLRNTEETSIRLLRRALESISDQHYPEAFELIVVDDGSPTPVQRILEENKLIYPGIRFVRTEKNYGLVSALNLGIKHARFPLIARIDADDRWVAGKIRTQLNAFGADPNLTIVATGMSLVKQDEILEELIRPGDWTGILKFFVEVGCPFPHGSVVAKRDIYRLLGGYPHDFRYLHCEDYTLWGIWLRFFKPAMIEQVLYEYTVSDNSISGQNAAVQAACSRFICGQFAKLNLASRLPAALDALSQTLHSTQLQAGVVAYRLWRFGIPVKIPVCAIEPIRAILCDRTVVPLSAEDECVLVHDLVEGFGDIYLPPSYKGVPIRMI
ncbi:MAG: glycosyltransferase [Bradyrhizobium sp.]|nr:glycosyltransferase [Bradyrhizobium sp.]